MSFGKAFKETTTNNEATKASKCFLINWILRQCDNWTSHVHNLFSQKAAANNYEDYMLQQTEKKQQFKHNKNGKHKANICNSKVEAEC